MPKTMKNQDDCRKLLKNMPILFINWLFQKQGQSMIRTKYFKKFF